MIYDIAVLGVLAQLVVALRAGVATAQSQYLVLPITHELALVVYTTTAPPTDHGHSYARAVVLVTVGCSSSDISTAARTIEGLCCHGEEDA